MFRPWLFRLRRRIQFLSRGSAPPALSFITLSRCLELTRSRDVILRLRLHRWTSDTEVAREFSNRSKLSRRFCMIARFAIFASEAKMCLAVQSERGVLTLAWAGALLWMAGYIIGFW